MTERSSAPVGSPSWADLWTSAVEGSRRSYGELFGWEADEPNPDLAPLPAFPQIRMTLDGLRSRPSGG
jgi:uncharacterized protein